MLRPDTSIAFRNSRPRQTTLQVIKEEIGP